MQSRNLFARRLVGIIVMWGTLVAAHGQDTTPGETSTNQTGSGETPSASVLSGYQAGTGKLAEHRGKHINLTTDLASKEEVDQLIRTFDAAVKQWETFWELPSGSLDSWKLDAYVMQEIGRFQKAGLIDPRVPQFPFGFAITGKAWVRVQKSPYYTRHLLLHEGMHVLAFHLFGDGGPTWFREGVADLLATHRGSNEDVRVGIVPGNRESVPYWGRFKRMMQLRNQTKLPLLETVMKYEPNLRGDVEAYGWSWALASMLHAYPEYRSTFLAAADHGRESDKAFNSWLYGRLANDWPIIQARWRLLVEDFDYGFDWERERVAIGRSDPLWDGADLQLDVQSDQGWQSIGVRLNRGMTVHLAATGKVVLDDVPKPWVSEPSGVTIEYHRGVPLGQLVARLVPIRSTKKPSGASMDPLPVRRVGKAERFQIESPCWLLLRVNDAPGSLANNRGHYQVTVSRK